MLAVKHRLISVAIIRITNSDSKDDPIEFSYIFFELP
jgi:hypothetical protein